MTALVIGGTGPTGHHIVNGLRARGHATTILHSGNREIPEIPEDVEHIHTDAYDGDRVAAALEGRTFDVCIAAYGRLRRIAEVTKGRVGQFVSIGGLPALRGYMNPMLFDPPGLPVPSSEEGDRVLTESDDTKGYRIVKTEDAVFENHPDAAHFRYPYAYGKYQPVPREWCIVKRILDRRPFIVLPDGGLTLHHFGYCENLAHAVLLAVDQPEAAAGQTYNTGDAEVLTLRQVVEVIARGLDYEWEIVSMPWEIAVPGRPLITQPLTTHRVMDIAKLRTQLGYRDVVPPREALVRTAKWLVDNPFDEPGPMENLLQDPFDYAAEDALVAGWKQALASIPEVKWEVEPGYGLAYSGPGGRARTQPTFD